MDHGSLGRPRRRVNRTPPARHRGPRSALVSALAGILAAAASAQEPPDVRSLLARLAEIEQLELAFEETWHDGERAVESRGRLSYRRPGRLLRAVEHPEPAEVAVEAGQAPAPDGDASKLARAAKERAFAIALADVLAGDEAALARAHRIAFSPREGEPGWTLRLKPRSGAWAALVDEIAVHGRGDRLERLVVEEAGGDRTVTRLSPAMAPGRPENATDLFAAFARMAGLEARFEEKKHLALLAVPLASRGRLYFMRPGYLARIIEHPEQSTVTITPTELRVRGPDGEEVVDLRQSDTARVFVTSLVRVFSGDEATLARSYGIEFDAGSAEAPWRLTLTPRAEPLTQIMKRLTLRGEGYRVNEIEVLSPNGDRTVTRILDANPERSFTPEEKARLFGIERR